MNADQKLGLRLSYVPDQPKSWKQATDEIRDIARIVRTSYNELVLDLSDDDEAAVPAIDGRKIKTPIEWNRVYKTQIRELWAKMPENVKNYICQRINF